MISLLITILLLSLCQVVSTSKTVASYHTTKGINASTSSVVPVKTENNSTKRAVTTAVTKSVFTSAKTSKLSELLTTYQISGGGYTSKASSLNATETVTRVFTSGTTSEFESRNYTRALVYENVTTPEKGTGQPRSGDNFTTKGISGGGYTSKASSLNATETVARVFTSGTTSEFESRNYTRALVYENVTTPEKGTGQPRSGDNFTTKGPTEFNHTRSKSRPYTSSNYTFTQLQPSPTTKDVNKSTNRTSASATPSVLTACPPSPTQLPPMSSARFIRSVRPIVYECESRTVTFLWIYATDGIGPPPRIFWRFLSPANKVDYTLMKQIPPQGLFKYDVYQDRAEFDYNAGFKLHNISFADEGPYSVEVIFDMPPDGPPIRLTNSTSLKVYPKQGCPIYTKYPKFNLTASGRAIGTNKLVGLQEPLSLTCDVPPSEPETRANLYWRSVGTDNTYFASCLGSSEPCSGGFTLSNVHLSQETQIVYVGVSFKYLEVDPVFQEDWIVAIDTMERARQDSNRIVANVCLLTFCHLAVILRTRIFSAT